MNSKTLFLFFFISAFFLNISIIQAEEKIAFIDLNVIFDNSKAGKQIIQQVQKLQKKNLSELKNLKEKFDKDREDLKKLVDKLKGLFDWSNVDFFTVESDPRRVDEDRLIYNHEVCGTNRISFGMQDLDPEVQRRVNRIQPAKLFENLLTPKVRKMYNA